MQVTKQQLDLDMEQWADSQLGKECVKAVYFHPAYLYVEYIMRNAEMNESQAGIKIARRSVNNPRYANDTTLMAESEEQLKRLLIRVKEETEKASLKLNIQKMKIIASGPITSWEKLGAVTDCISLGSEITADRD